MSGAAGIDSLDRALDRAAGARRIPGNAVTHLTDGPEAFAAMLEIVDQADRWVHFENYIIRSDPTGARFAERLQAAARRGVHVRVLYDHFGSFGTRRSYWAALRDAGVHVRAYNRVNPLRPLRSLRRDHRKYVAADGRAAVLGGICIGQEWSGSDDTGEAPWRDTAVRVAGPAVPALEYTFLRRWRDAGGEDHDLGAAARPEARGDATVRVVDGVPGRLRLFRALQLLLAAAEERVWITDAYLVAPSPTYTSMLAAARDSVDVRLLVPGKTDLPWIRALTRVGYRELLEAGVRIWEWHGPVLHAKTVIVDDRWFKVGSSNLNPSSLFANDELDILVDDRAVAQAAIQQFRRDLGEAVEIVIRPRAVFPPAIVRAAALTTGSRPSALELSRRAAVTLRHVAGGARRSITGALFFVSLGVTALFLLLPRAMAYVVAALSLGLSLNAAWHFVLRRRYRPDE